MDIANFKKSLKDKRNQLLEIFPHEGAYPKGPEHLELNAMAWPEEKLRREHVCWCKPRLLWDDHELNNQIWLHIDVM